MTSTFATAAAFAAPVRVDLHGLTWKQARVCIDSALTQLARKDGPGSVLLVAGAGKHSGQGGAVLRHETKGLLIARGLAFTETSHGTFHVSRRRRTESRRGRPPPTAQPFEGQVGKAVVTPEAFTAFQVAARKPHTAPLPWSAPLVNLSLGSGGGGGGEHWPGLSRWEQEQATRSAAPPHRPPECVQLFHHDDPSPAMAAAIRPSRSLGPGRHRHRRPKQRGGGGGGGAGWRRRRAPSRDQDGSAWQEEPPPPLEAMPTLNRELSDQAKVLLLGALDLHASGLGEDAVVDSDPSEEAPGILELGPFVKAADVEALVAMGFSDRATNAVVLHRHFPDDDPLLGALNELIERLEGGQHAD